MTTDAERGDVLTFDGNDRIDVANSVSTLGDQVTIAAWVNLDAGQQDNIFLSIGDEFYIILDNSNPSLSMGSARQHGFTTSSLNAQLTILLAKAGTMSRRRSTTSPKRRIFT